MPAPAATKTGAVIVSFNPDPARLAALTGILAAQVSQLVVVDNTPGGGIAAADLPANASVLSKGYNAGIAEALNDGIRVLLDAGCDFVFLSDQDSLPAADIVAELLQALHRLEACGERVASVNAAFVDPRDNSFHGFPTVGWRGMRVAAEPDATGYVPMSFAITSGSLIPRQVLADIGLMEAGLFIDMVDVEWSYRATSRGCQLYGVPTARMAHTIGDQTVRFWFGGWRVRNVHSPFRVYFQFRNFVALLPRSYIPLRFKFWMLRNRLNLTYIYLFVLRRQRWQYILSIARGISHGLLGKTGNPDR
jgi:rhamnosyltransferase